MSLILRDVELDGQIRDVTASGARTALIDGAYVDIGEETIVVDARGGALLPGLHDHHLHLLAMAAESVDCALAASLADLGTLLRKAPGPWIRATGYHESIGGDLDRHVLDRLVDDRPVRVQHRSGALWVLNSVALREAAAALDDSADVERDQYGEPTGRLWRYDARLRRALPAVEPDLAAVGDRLLRLGLTGVTDATPDLDPTAIALLIAARRRGALPQDLTLLGAPDDFIDSAWAVAGPAKLLLRDHDLPDPDTVAAWMAARHAAGRPVAVHCVTSDALAITLAAFGTAGTIAGDRLEHAAIVPPGLREDVLRLGLRVVTNPGFLRARGDTYIDEVVPGELPYLYPHRSLAETGIQVTAASDAPYGDPDPWRVIRDAASRTTATGRILSPAEAVTPGEALAGYLSPPDDPGGEPVRLRVGHVGGLCLLRTPLAQGLAAPDADSVRLVATGARIDDISPAADTAGTVGLRGRPDGIK